MWKGQWKRNGKVNGRKGKGEIKVISVKKNDYEVIWVFVTDKTYLCFIALVIPIEKVNRKVEKSTKKSTGMLIERSM